MSNEELELMTQLLSFYKKRYEGTELETKFNEACVDLIETNDIKKASYMKFCVENDVEPRIIKKPASSSSSFDNGCGGGGGRVARNGGC